MTEITREQAIELATATPGYAETDVAELIDLLLEVDPEEGAYVVTTAGIITWDGENYQLDADE